MSDDLERDHNDPAQLVGLPWHSLDLNGSLDLDNGAGPALRRDGAALDALVSGALQRVSVVRTPWWRSRRTAPLVGVGIIAISTAAAAAAGLGPRLLAAFGGQPASTPVVAVSPSTPEPRLGAAAVAPSQSAAPLASEIAPVVAEVNPPERSSVVTAAEPAPVQRALAASAGALKPARSTPEDLLARASKLRKAKSYREALAIYEQVLARYPGTRQAALARVAAAQLELSQLGAVQSAQRRFKEAQGDRDVGPEALFGLAEACRAQGDVAGERGALQRLVSKHPDSPLAATAQQRLAALGLGAP